MNSNRSVKKRFITFVIVTVIIASVISGLVYAIGISQLRSIGIQSYESAQQMGLIDAAKVTELEAQMNNCYYIVVGIAALLIVIIVLAVYKCASVFGKVIFDPLADMAECSKKLSNGDFNFSLTKAEGNNELVQLQNSFCEMTENFMKQAKIIYDCSNGDMTNDVCVKCEEDYLGRALLKMVEENNQVLSSVQRAALEIDTGSSQIAAASQSLAQGSTQQAAAIEQISASVDNIAEKARVNAEKIGDVRQIIGEADAMTIEGNNKMKHMIVAMEDISTASNNIKKVIKLMNDISFSTNILALNANVEASRAGEFGKGFAVVANEVQQLAQKSAQASAQIEEMIEDSIVKVNYGMTLVKETGASLEEILESINTINAISGDLVVASEEQAVVAAQIDQAIGQVSNVIQTNSAASEECAAASEQLAGQARVLKTQMSRYRLKI